MNRAHIKPFRFMPFQFMPFRIFSFRTKAFRLIVGPLLLGLVFAGQIKAQTPSSQEATKAGNTKPEQKSDQKADQKKAEEDPFAPEPAPPLPAGMTGSDTSDPRAKLKPGWYDAGEASLGLKHLLLLKKPGPFQLDAVNPDDPRVQKTLGMLGVADPSKMPKPMQLVIAQLAFANSDLAFQGHHLFQGNFYGVNIYDISDPAKAKLVTSMVCPGGQGDVSVYKNLLFMSVEMPNGRLDCGVEGFPPDPAPADESDKGDKKLDAEKDKGKDSQTKDAEDQDK